MEEYLQVKQIHVNLEERYDQVMGRDLAGFNAMLRGKNLQGIIAP